MHARGVERVVAIADAQKSGALLESLGAEPRHFFQLASRAKAAVGVAIGDNARGQSGAEAGDARQQRRRSGVEIDADRVDAILHHRVERARQLEFREIMLVLADADGFGVDLDQFGQRVLQAPRDRHGAAQGHVEIGQFAGRVGRGRINRGAGLRHHDLGQFLLRQLRREFGGQLVGLARRRAVADGDQFDLVQTAQPSERQQRVVPAPLRLMRIDHPGVDHFAGGVHHRHFDAGAEAGIEAHGGARSGGRGEQQIAQIARENFYGLILGVLPQAGRADRPTAKF